jgi:hypothetical protein
MADDSDHTDGTPPKPAQRDARGRFKNCGNPVGRRYKPSPLQAAAKELITDEVAKKMVAALIMATLKGSGRSADVLIRLLPAPRWPLLRNVSIESAGDVIDIMRKLASNLVAGTASPDEIAPALGALGTVSTAMSLQAIETLAAEIAELREVADLKRNEPTTTATAGTALTLPWERTNGHQPLDREPS